MKNFTKNSIQSNGEIMEEYISVDGAQGAEINLSSEYEGGPFGRYSFRARLVIPPNSFQGKKNFTIAVDALTAMVSLTPTPFTFEKEIDLTLEYKGIDLNSLNPNSINFYYVSGDGSLEVAHNSGINIDLEKGELSVFNAKLPHFSVYAFGR